MGAGITQVFAASGPRRGGP
nr:hypothetical protein [Mycolicibacterium smegmatis]